MVKITKVYTRTGDAGETGLVGGRRLKKIHPRIEAYGTVDELNSLVGIVRSLNQSKEASTRGEKFELILEAIQHKSTPSSSPRTPRWSPAAACCSPRRVSATPSGSSRSSTP